MSRHQRQCKPDEASVREFLNVIYDAIESNENVQSLVRKFIANGNLPGWDIRTHFHPTSPRKQRRKRRSNRQLVRKNGKVVDDFLNESDLRFMHRLGVDPVSE